MFTEGDSTLASLCGLAAQRWLRPGLFVTLIACFMCGVCQAQSAPASGTYTPTSVPFTIGVPTTFSSTTTASGCTDPSLDGTSIQSGKNAQGFLLAGIVYAVTVANGAIVPQFDTPTNSTEVNGIVTTVINGDVFQRGLQIGTTVKETITAVEPGLNDTEIIATSLLYNVVSGTITATYNRNDNGTQLGSFSCLETGTYSESGSATLTVPVTFVPSAPGTATIGINAIQLDQAVAASDIDGDGVVDLVANRPTEVFVTGTVSGGDPNGNQTVTIHVVFGSQSCDGSDTDSVFTTGLGVQCQFTPNAPSPSTPVTVRATYQNASANSTTPAEVKLIRTIRLSFINVDYLGANPDYSQMTINGPDYLQAVYPLAVPQFPAPTDLGSYVEPLLPLPSRLGAAQDAVRIWLMMVMSGSERAVAVVSQNWLDSHSITDSGGAQFTNLPGGRKVAFALDDDITAIAHELGHTYGFPEDYTRLPDGTCQEQDPTTGFWVQKPDIGSIPFSGEETFSYMTCDLGVLPRPYPAGVERRWATTDNFSALFKNFIQPSSDPELLLVTGFASQNGNGSFDQMYRTLNGQVTELPTPGIFALQVLDSNMKMISQVSFGTDMTAANESTPFASPIAPFGISVPFPSNAAVIQLLRNGSPIASSNIISSLMSNVIASLPDTAFGMNPEQRRTALLNKIAAFDQQLSAGDLVGARNNLQNDIETQINNWLVDGYATTTPLEYTKQQILDLISELLQRLGA
jgi:hypothetical protein